jgi:hypothetical protein
MRTIAVTPQSALDEPTSDVVFLEIYVKNDDFDGFFDRLEVWRSKRTDGGPYSEITASSWKQARVPEDASDPPTPAVTGASVFVVGKALHLRLKEDEDLIIVFTGTDPLTLTQVASQITAQGQNKVRGYVDKDGRLTIETFEPGTGAVLRVLDTGDAAPIVGLPTKEPDSLAYGKDARIHLIQNKELYQFSDLFGSSSYFYKTRFRNALSGAVSDFSQAFSTAQAIGVTEPNVVCGQLELIAIDGKPLIGQEVRIHTKFNGSIVEGKVVAGGDCIKRTDKDGKVQFLLVRGQSVAVALSGTDLIRDVVVPTDSTIKVFNLFDPSIAGPDIFKVQVPELIVAERRTL